MKPIVEKVLRSGLVDKSMAELMEKYKMIPEGASEMVREDALKGATMPTLQKLAEDLATELEKEHKIRETHLDLERIRWPVTVSFAEVSKTTTPRGEPVYLYIASDITGVRDRMGRFFFRLDDTKEDWFKPGHVLLRKQGTQIVAHIILEAQQLYLDEAPVCWQVAVQ